MFWRVILSRLGPTVCIFPLLNATVGPFLTGNRDTV